jgi:alcohol dehydrogenase (cytochrome c)
MLVDAEWEGRPRKLLLDANLNGFFHALDRTKGKPLRRVRFVNKSTWAREIGPDGRPVMNSNQLPTEKGLVGSTAAKEEQRKASDMRSRR